MSETTPEEWANLRRWWFDSVYEISNLEHQRRTWLNPPTPSPHWSYVEFCCKYPDADQLQHARRHGQLSSKEFELLATVGAEISSHTAPDQYDHCAILEDPAWHAVVAAAERVRRQLLTLITDPIERDCLLGR